MRFFVVLALAALASAQMPGGGFGSALQEIRDNLAVLNAVDDVIDSYHNWRLEDHQTDLYHLLLFINDLPDSRYCYVVRVNRSYEALLDDPQNVQIITEELYALVNDPSHQERPVDLYDLADSYHDFEAAKECRGHRTYSIFYRPSFA